MSNISDIKLQNQSAFSLYERNQADLELSQVAEEFESLFVSQMLKQAHKSKLADGIFDSSSQETYQSLLDQEWSRKLSANASFGIAEAIKLQFQNHLNSNLNICVLEKASEIGAHILSGNVFETRALDELIPNWKDLNPPIKTKVTKEKFLFLGKTKSLSWPTWLLPAVQKNHKNYIISLANLCRWLAEQAETLGVEIFPGFPASEILFNDDGSVKGVATQDMGIDKQ